MSLPPDQDAAPEAQPPRLFLCYRCQQAKPRDAFDSSKQRPGEPTKTCKACAHGPAHTGPQRISDVIGPEQAARIVAGSLGEEAAAVFGAVTSVDEARQALQGHLGAMLQVALARALAGDDRMMKLCLDAVGINKSVQVNEQPELLKWLAGDPGQLTDTA